jgi:AcrR family transcriptional regulator
MVKADKRDEIVRAALELIAEHGFHGAPMAMIADRAGVGAGTIYRYFENKDVLINGLYQDLEVKIFQAVLDGYGPEKPLRDRFMHVGATLLRYFIDNALDFRFLEQYHNSPYGVEHRRDKILGKKEENNCFRALFEEGVAHQVMKDFPLPILFALFFGPVLSVARDHVLGFIRLDAALIEQTVGACWDAVKR